MFEHGPLQVTGAPHLGADVFGVTRPTAPPVPLDPLATAVLLELRKVTSEVRGLRADLASRTFSARLTRFWHWLTGR